MAEQMQAPASHSRLRMQSEGREDKERRHGDSSGHSAPAVRTQTQFSAQLSASGGSSHDDWLATGTVQSLTPEIIDSLFKCIGDAMAATSSPVARDFALSNVWFGEENGLLIASKMSQTIAASKTDNEEILFFIGQSSDYTFTKGGGMLGTCWQKNEMMWIEDVSQLTSDQYYRLSLAVNCNIKATFVVPFVVCDATLALVEFVSQKKVSRDNKLLADIRSGMQRSLFHMNTPATSSIDAPQAEGDNDTLAYANAPLRLRSLHEQWNIKRNDIKLVSKIAEGSHGEVWKATWRELPVAAKTLKSFAAVEEGGQREADLLREISVLSRMRHPNLILFLGACLENSPIWLLNEYLEGANVEDLFREQSTKRGGVPWRPKQTMVHGWATDLARALAFLHSCEPPVVHRDLKPANLLLTKEGVLKVGDFGLSKTIRGEADDLGAYEMTGGTGTLRYMAPEVMGKDTVKYNEKVDIYSYGIILWAMCTGDNPMWELAVTNPTTFVSRVRGGFRPDPERIDNFDMRRIIEGCWGGNYKNRMSASELVQALSCMTPHKNQHYSQKDKRHDKAGGGLIHKIAGWLRAKSY